MFDDADLKSHVRATFGRGGVAGYDRVDTYGKRDAQGEGVEGHTAKLRREREARLSLSDVAKGSYVTRLRWSR